MLDNLNISIDRNRLKQRLTFGRQNFVDHDITLDPNPGPQTPENFCANQSEAPPPNLESHSSLSLAIQNEGSQTPHVGPSWPPGPCCRQCALSSIPIFCQFVHSPLPPVSDSSSSSISRFPLQTLSTTSVLIAALCYTSKGEKLVSPSTQPGSVPLKQPVVAYCIPFFHWIAVHPILPLHVHLQIHHMPTLKYPEIPWLLKGPSQLDPSPSSTQHPQ
ncbi:hypothetical protein DSO57_1028074 [Entomophthora muscae]|uniref:Uncharacterized protein n=1 Tax=Entomophthora muscae TaxID=34485 RepID=A0ACC2S3D5_9FUNG|nr:hypothetical protein DSO57_1028074 [Entomophthora muscae]